jgi:hypothetical protein
MDGTTIAAIKELKRVVKFVLNTRNYGLVIKPKEPGGPNWDLIMYTDSDYAGDKDCRISVTGYILYLCGVAISWKSKGQKSVTQNLLYKSYCLWGSLSRVDNVGAIFMAENVTMSTRRRHVDVRYHFVREFVEDGFIKIIFYGLQKITRISSQRT